MIPGRERRPLDRDRRDPSFFVWLLALIGLVLPWIGIALCFVGAGRVVRELPYGWPLIASGLVLVILDVVIDFVLADPRFLASDDPDLNRRGLELIGRSASVAEAIVDGRGKIAIGDTLWLAEGPDLATGVAVRIVGVHGTLLRVEPL